jgi:hypothetical protein
MLEPGHLYFLAREAEIEANATLTVLCRAAHDHVGSFVEIFDNLGASRSQFELGAVSDEVAQTDQLEFTGPNSVGTFEWTARLVAEDEDEPVEAVLSFAVRPIKTTLLVWDTPSAVPIGTPFAVKIGLKGSDGGNMSGMTVVVTDAAGLEVGRTAFTDAVLAGSEALHFVELELRGSDALGIQQFSLSTEASEQPPRLAAEASLRVKHVPAPECHVEISVMDSAGSTPLAGAEVQLHPYRSRTDATGVARFFLPKGEYRLTASKAKHEANSLSIVVDTDCQETIRLAQEALVDPDAHYY